MIGGIISDAKAMEMEATRSEESAQKAYDAFVADTNKSIEDCNVEITNKDEARAKAEGEKAETDVSLESVMADLQNLSNEKADLGSQCDFTMANFDERQAARDEEIESLRQSVQILQGADLR